MGIVGKTSTMKGTILIALALLVASCQLKPAKHFLIETKTNTDDEPAGKGEDYLHIGHNWGKIGGNHNSGTIVGSQGGNHNSGHGNSFGSFGQTGGQNQFAPRQGFWK